jgi:thiol-disulfide isomerase/thioredoxin
MLTAIIITLLAQFFTTRPAEKSPKEVKVMNFDKLQPYLHRSDDTVYLVNFWATWCLPCRKEMPSIMAVEEKYGNKNFKVLLVSLDFPGQLESNLLPYLAKNNITSQVILLDDPDQNRWINLIDPNWSGELPYTLIYGKDFRESHYGEMSFDQLDETIGNKINDNNNNNNNKQTK